MDSLEDFFKYEDSAKKEEMVKTPSGNTWFTKVTVTEESDRQIIPVPDGWTVGIKVGHDAPVFLSDTGEYLKPKNKALEQGVVVSFLRQRGRVRCGVPFENIRLADGNGFGFAAYFNLVLQQHNEARFFDAVFAEEENLTDIELVDKYVRALVTNCLARDFRELDLKQIASGTLELSSRIRTSVNHTAKTNNLPSSLGLLVANVVLESTKTERLGNGEERS